MGSFLKKILHAGVRQNTPEFEARPVIMANTVAMIIFILASILLLYISRNGFTFSDTLVLAVIGAVASIPFLNRAGQTLVGRSLLIITLPLATLTIVFQGRINDPMRYEYTRSAGLFCIMLASAVIPVLIFSSREKKIMYFSMAANFVLFGSLDIFLRYFSQQRAFPTGAQYLSGNLVLLIAHLIMVGSVLALKRIIDDYERRNEELISYLNERNHQLHSANLELHELNKNIETQNEEIVAQSEELIQGQENLVLANVEIERQKLKLEEQNEILSKTLDERSKDLLHSNKQLVAQNNELHQFSYTVSHNLRGPVASMLGLVNIHSFAQSEEEKDQIVSLLKQSAESLETVIVDLNKIIEIRNDKFSVYEEISLEHELSLVTKSLSTFITASEVKIESTFTVDTILSVKTYIHSILYNLVSNAIQYRAFERKPVIHVSSEIRDGYTMIQVSDNGLGIDLGRHKSDLFKLYKRFHSHTQGKGLGLYLVNQHVEKLNGRIEVDSKPDVGTTFRVFLPVNVGK